MQSILKMSQPSNSLNSRLKGVLFDIDGTLIDSNDAHALAWVDTFSKEGLSLPFAAVRRLIGKGGDKLLPELTGIDPESAQGKAIFEFRKEIFLNNYLPK